MEIPAAREVTDRRGNLLPDPPSPEDIERQADSLRIVQDDEVPEAVLQRLGLDELEQRRLQAITK